jgi:Cysteine-rich secretory protein family
MKQAQSPQPQIMTLSIPEPRLVIANSSNGFADWGFMPRSLRLSYKLPDTGKFSSAHVLINQERAIRGLPTLQRSRFLDELARLQAESLAKGGEDGYDETMIYSLHEWLKCENVGESLLQGADIRSIHRSIMLEARGTPYDNMMNPDFTEVGVGTAKAPGLDGPFYMVQLFASTKRHAYDCGHSQRRSQV